MLTGITIGGGTVMEKKKYGWTAKGIVAFCFIPMGLLFLPLGLLLWHYKAGNNPDGPEIFLYSFGGMGLVFLLIGLGLLLADLHRRALLRRAWEGGYYVMAKIAGTEYRNNVNINGRCPVVVEAHYTDPDTGVAHVWFSRFLYVNVGDLLQSEEVPVYIDRMNGDVGFVDVDAVLPQIRVHK